MLPPYPKFDVQPKTVKWGADVVITGSTRGLRREESEGEVDLGVGILYGEEIYKVGASLKSERGRVNGGEGYI